jgi:hypothetical protein
MSLTSDLRRWSGVAVCAAVVAGLLSAALLAQPEASLPAGAPSDDAALATRADELRAAALRLPLAAALGAALALRPRRRGTPERQMSVVETQIVLALVGALIMLVVGSSLARAFGIVGAASLIRYRSKIDDPKDAGVMLCCLAVGLASGVGLYGLAVFASLFMVGALALIESFEPKNVTQFTLQVKGVADVADLRPRFEQALTKFRVEHSLRTQSNDELSYDVKVPFELETERVTNAILKLDPSGKVAVEWDERKTKKS